MANNHLTIKSSRLVTLAADFERYAEIDMQIDYNLIVGIAGIIIGAILGVFFTCVMPDTILNY